MNSSLARFCASRGRMVHVSAPLVQVPHPIPALAKMGVTVLVVDRKKCITANFGIRAFKRKYPQFVRGNSLRAFKRNAWEVARG